MDDLISRQEAIEEQEAYMAEKPLDGYEDECSLIDILKKLPSAQPEPAIPLSWIENHIERLQSLDNAFANLTAVQISTMVQKWRDEKDG